MTRVVSSMMVRLIVLVCSALPALAEWDPKSGTPDPFTAARMMSREAERNPDLLRKDPDHFRKLFGTLASEMGETQHVEEAKTDVTPKHMCIACHGAVVETEKALAARHQSKKRDPSELTEALEEICQMERYNKMDPMKVTSAKAAYGMSPYIFVNACRKVVEAWNGGDEVEDLLLAGAPPEQMHRQLRESICNAKGFGICSGALRQLEFEITQGPDGKDMLLTKEDSQQCKAAITKGKKAKKASKVDPISGEDINAQPSYKIHDA